MKKYSLIPRILIVLLQEGVWGAHLNKKKPSEQNQNKDPKDGVSKKKLKSTPSFMDKLGQKLLENSAKVVS